MNMAENQIGFRIDPKLIQLLKKEAEKQGRTLSNLLKYIVVQYIASINNKGEI